MRDDAVLRRALPLGRGLGLVIQSETITERILNIGQTAAVICYFIFICYVVYIQFKQKEDQTTDNLTDFCK